MIKPEKTTESDTINDQDSPLEEIQLGVYRLYLEKNKFRRFEFNYNRISAAWEKWVKTYQVTVRLFREVIPLAPGLFLTSILLNAWEGLQSVVLGTLEGRILRIVEHGISTRSLDSKALGTVLIVRLAFMSLQAGVLHRWSTHIDTSLESHIMNYFDELILTAKLRMDLPTVQDNISFDHLNPSLGYRTVKNMFSLLSQLIVGVGHIFLILFTARRGSSNHGATFTLLCILRPVLTGMNGFSIFMTPRVIEANNKHYLRILSLKELVDTKYRLDIISGNIVEYILDQYKAAKNALSSTSTEQPEWTYMRSGFGDLSAIPLNLLGDLPMRIQRKQLYFVSMAILNPSEVSLAALATVQASSRSLEAAYFHAMYILGRLAADSASIRQIYDIQSIKKVVKDEGRLSYPPEHGSEKGMSNVTFTYPGSKNTTNALDDVSFKIGAGELVVVVGANGSGKSTFVNILSRLYDPTSGQVLVDGVDIKDYQLSDIRRGIATLTQDHHLYPLSLRENIGLGSIDDMSNDDLIAEAARKGGAEQLIAKLEDGLDSVLNPKLRQYAALVDEGGNSPLARKFKELKKTSNVSGGERQRLVASRTFMRFNSTEVKFVAADEPTAALDPEGELALFTQLRQEREGKTMLFITHRFGPLVKYADRIICMKDGKIVESGDHATLMALEGEYCKMWSIQAKSFES
ncbi:hypothetical protein V5O48_006588 [Marasmius crinis-equi]|uniref:ABC transporter domain-containing protein n=1 Tax=Marasmius crinis-equi TaxID=585013 RepID=A0ABR3FJ27_9AGAR